MKKRWIGLRVAAALCAALGWWGLIYPELTLTSETVKISSESGENDPETEWRFDNSLYLDLLNAGPEKITFRSRLLQEISLIWEAFHDSNGKQDK